MKPFATVIFVAAACSLKAQPSGREIVNQPIEWFATTANLKLNKHFTLVLDGQYRFARDFEPQQFQARTMLDIAINDHLSIAPLAYVYTWNYLYGEQPASFRNNEHRIFQQVFVKHDLWHFKLDHRLRIEQRFIAVHRREGEQVIDEGYTNRQNRVRYRFMARLPLRGTKIEPGTFFASAYDEVFYSWGDPITFHEPDQNRIFAGAGYQVNPGLSVQIGPLYQMLIKANGAQQENNIGFLLMATYNVDLTK